MNLNYRIKNLVIPLTQCDGIILLDRKDFPVLYIPDLRGCTITKSVRRENYR